MRYRVYVNGAQQGKVNGWSDIKYAERLRDQLQLQNPDATVEVRSDEQDATDPVTPVAPVEPIDAAPVVAELEAVVDAGIDIFSEVMAQLSAAKESLVALKKK